MRYNYYNEFLLFSTLCVDNILEERLRAKEKDTADSYMTYEVRICADYVAVNYRRRELKIYAPKDDVIRVVLEDLDTEESLTANLLLLEDEESRIGLNYTIRLIVKDFFEKK